MKGGRPAPPPRGLGHERPSRRPSRRALLRGAVIAAAVLVALIAWLTTRGGGSSASAPSAAALPRIVSTAGLREAAGQLGQPIYWAGPIAGMELVLKELGDGRGVQLLYMPEGVPAGQAPAKALTVGSYPLSDPRGALDEGYAKRPGSIVRHTRDGREVVSSSESPTSVYFASPDNSVQVEVYDPSPKRAMSLALSGQVEPAR